MEQLLTFPLVSVVACHRILLGSLLLRGRYGLLLSVAGSWSKDERQTVDSSWAGVDF